MTQTAYGGPGGSRTRVQNAFTLKGLQLYAYYSALYLVSQLIWFNIFTKSNSSL